MTRLASVLIAALTLACGPKEPDDTTTGTTSETTSASTSTTSTTTTSTGAPATTSGDDPIPGTTTSATTSASTEATATTELGPCVVDPANDICSAACDESADCCKCNGQTFLPDPMAQSCTLAMGIVTAFCHWGVDNLWMDREWLPVNEPDQCDAATSGWTQFGQNGDIVIELCGQTCTDYLAGKFEMLQAGMFCESA